MKSTPFSLNNFRGVLFKITLFFVAQTTVSYDQLREVTGHIRKMLHRTECLIYSQSNAALKTFDSRNSNLYENQYHLTKLPLRYLN